MRQIRQWRSNNAGIKRSGQSVSSRQNFRQLNIAPINKTDTRIRPKHCIGHYQGKNRNNGNNQKQTILC